MKKRLLSIFTASVLIFSSLTAVHCEDDIKVLLDGSQIEFDVPPQIIDDRTLVPMRAIFETLGAEVLWSGELQFVEARKDNTVIQMYIGNNVINIIKNGAIFADMVTLDVPPQIIDGRTLVPVRAVSESFDCLVDWNSDTRTVIISTTDTALAPEPSIAPTDAPHEYPIEYDDTNERQAHYIRNFEITDISKNSDGNYDISYTLETFLEGRGTVSVEFNCLDENGAVVDTFGEIFVGTDYTWSPQKSSVTVSGKTAKIELLIK